MAGRKTHRKDERLIVGMFHDREHAERAIRDLRNAGFTDQDIGVALKGERSAGELAEGPATHVEEGATTGAVGGGILGGVLGLLAGAGAVVLPVIGPVAAAGWLGATLAGAGIGAAAGGLVGALIGAGIPEEDARYFEAGLTEGRILVTVEPGHRDVDAVTILRRHDADLGPTRMRAAETPATKRASRAASQPKVGRRASDFSERASDVTVDRPRYAGPERRISRSSTYLGPERRAELR